MTRQLRFLVSTAFLCLLPLAGGCAFGTRNVALLHTPAPVPLAQGQGRARVELFGDVRSSKASIGEVRNLYGMKTAKVKAVNDPAQWVTDAIATELQRAGVDTRADITAPAGVEPCIIRGELREFYTKMYFKYTCTLRARVVVVQGQRVLIDKEYWAKAEGGANVASAAEYAQMSSSALGALLGQCVPEIVGSIRQQPTTALTQRLRP